MYAFLEGKIEEHNPSYIVINCGGVGYHVEISLSTYSKIKDLSVVRLLVHQVVREDAHTLYGFFDERERHLFRLLISVSGIGSTTARMILSSLSVDEAASAILSGDAHTIQSVKGIGAKTAQRVILELRDKVSGESIAPSKTSSFDNKAREEALSALVMLGFNKSSAEKSLDSILKNNPDGRVEQLIKQALKLL